MRPGALHDPQATGSDAVRLAEIHVAALPADLLPRIGATFLSRRDSPTVLGSDSWIVLVDEDESAIRSFVVFALEPERLLAELRPQLLSVVWHLGKATIRRPSIVPAHQSGGIGSALIEGGLAVVTSLGRGCVVKTSSRPSRQFYERHGFHPIGTERRSTRTLDVLMLKSAGNGPRELE